MGVSFTRDRFAVAWPGIEPLLAAHWREVAYPGGFPADDAPVADVATYLEADAAGRLVCFTVRAPGDSVVGYAMFWVGPFPQRCGMLAAWAEAVYLRPEARDGRTGAHFLRFCEEELRGLGIRVIHHSVRAGRDFSPVLDRLGYVQAEVVYAKHLEP